MARSPRYSYYAGGKSVRLRRDRGVLGLDGSHPAFKTLPAALRRSLQSAGQALRPDKMLIPADALDPAQRESLEEEGAVLPVFREGDAQLVALPEVRVECDGDEQFEAVLAFVEAREVVELVAIRRSGRISFRPASRRAHEALLLANEIYRKFRPGASQVRFLRRVPRAA